VRSYTYHMAFYTNVKSLDAYERRWAMNLQGFLVTWVLKKAALAYSTTGGPTDHYVQQQIASPQVATRDAFSSARTWLRECLQTHSSCPKITTGTLPTRALDLNELSELQDIIRLKEATPSEIGQYIALSYCWGPQGQSIMIKESTQKRNRN